MLSPPMVTQFLSTISQFLEFVSFFGIKLCLYANLSMVYLMDHSVSFRAGA